jgi:hypothetical protein
MKIALATAWHPRGELPRFERLLPVLRQLYNGIAISLPPDAGAETLAALQRLALPGRIVDCLDIRPILTADWSWGRHQALETAAAFPVEYIQYADFDRLLRWVETRPEEWGHAVAAIRQADCTIFGRSPAAYATHPKALVQTEAISNRVVSHLLGQPVDVSAGSKGFRRSAVEYILNHCPPGRALGTDALWTVTLQRAGFSLQYLEVDGLDWESADRHQEQAAGPLEQQLAAQAYDADPENWSRRVAVAMEVVTCGLEAAGENRSYESFFGGMNG